MRLILVRRIFQFSIVAGVLPLDGGKPEVCRIETTEKAIRRFIDKLGGSAGLSVCYEAGPGGFAVAAAEEARHRVRCRRAVVDPARVG